MAQIMRSRPMVPGRVRSIGATGILVKLDDRNATRRYDLSEVFFYQGEQLRDAATSSDKLHKGDSVMVPDSAGQVS